MFPHCYTKCEAPKLPLIMRLSAAAATTANHPLPHLRRRSTAINSSLISEFRPKNNTSSNFQSVSSTSKREDSLRDENGRGGGGGNVGAGVHVPRQKYIPISKAELLDALLSMFGSPQEQQDFLLLSSCLESILHAEHKGTLEEMRLDYDLTHSIGTKTALNYSSVSLDGEIPTNGRVPVSSMDNPEGCDNVGKNIENKAEHEKSIPSNFAVGSEPLPVSWNKSVEHNSFEESRVPVATRFQRAFVQLLYNAQFEELSAADLMLTSALNTDYLLTLPIYVDWKKAFESKAIIFRRGYAVERQKGLLIVEKLDFLQSKLLQVLFLYISKPLGKLGLWFTEALRRTIEEQDAEVWVNKVKLWLKETPFWKSYSYDDFAADDNLGVDRLSDKDLPIWLAAQRAVTRYEGILSSVGPRFRLLKKLLMWTGLIPSLPEKLSDFVMDTTASEPYLRPIFLSRISLSDIWEPASRKFCGNNPWKMLKSAISILLSRSILQEPAFQELILLYTEETAEEETVGKDEVPMLLLKIYEKIPIPELPVIFPHKKLSFRILDTVRLDAATVLGLLAYFINYKFESILSSPSAFLLDVIAVSALVIYVFRIALGYKQTWDRYQLLVNRTLYEKTVASGFGSVHFLLDASEQQQYKEAILAYAILLELGSTQGAFAKNVGDKCERFMYDVFKKKVEMPIDKAVNTLVRLGLAAEKEVGGETKLHPVPCTKAYQTLKQHWNSFC